MADSQQVRLLDRNHCVLLVIDVQERFRPVIDRFEDIVKRCNILVKGAKRLGIPVLVSEQYPKGLGATVTEISETLSETEIPMAKMGFSALSSYELNDKLRSLGKKQLLICGLETHVCVLQTAMECLGYFPKGVYLAVDAVSSRQPAERELAIRRMESAGIRLVSSEGALFEWLRTAESPEFKDLQSLVK